MGVTQSHLAVEDGAVGSAFDLQFSLGNSLQRHVGADEETVQKLQRKIVQTSRSFIGSSLSVEIDTVDFHHFFLSAADEGGSVVFTVALRQINRLHAHLSQRSTLKGEVIGLQRSDCGEFLAGDVVGHVDIAAEHARQAGKIGEHGGELAKIDVIHAQGQVVGGLHGVRPGSGETRVGAFFVGVTVIIFWFAVDSQSGAVVSHQVDVCFDTFVATEKEEVVFVDREATIGKDGVVGIEMHL